MLATLFAVGLFTLGIFGAIKTAKMATRLSPEGHSGNIPAKHTPLLIFLILNPHIRVKIEDIF
jgi:hypothetical protein